jgi:uncharacterized protein YqiB (DUF1249 family)
MQAPDLYFARLALLTPPADVGGLMALCEENYGALLRLAPSLPRMTTTMRSKPFGRAELSLTILEQSRYTSSLRLTHILRADAMRPRVSEPDALLRAYHDAGQVEVLQLRQTVLPILKHYQSPALAAKWRVNLFLNKWLGYCLQQGYRFHAGAEPDRAADAALLLSSD